MVCVCHEILDQACGALLVGEKPEKIFGMSMSWTKAPALLLLLIEEVVHLCFREQAFEEALVRVE